MRFARLSLVTGSPSTEWAAEQVPAASAAEEGHNLCVSGGIAVETARNILKHNPAAQGGKWRGYGDHT